jgi:MYXO-CTERM domain-containing protein
MHNNVIVKPGGGGAKLWNMSEQEGADPVFFGSHNWIQEGITDIPGSFTGTLSGAAPGFADMTGFDYRLADASPLINGGTTDTSIASPAFIDPLMEPTTVPPSRSLGTNGDRPHDATIDIGAFEFGSGSIPGDGNGSGNGTPPGGDGNGNGNGADGDNAIDGGCNCRVGERAVDSGWSLAGGMAALGAALVLARRRRHRA